MNIAEYRLLRTDGKRSVLTEYRSQLIDKLAQNVCSGIIGNKNTLEKIPEPQSAFPVVEMQEAFLVSRFLTKNGDHVGCHIYLEFVVEDLDMIRLQSSWKSVVDRHMMLRVKIGEDGTQQVLDVANADSFQLHRPGIGKDVYQVRKEMSGKVYEPGQWPLFEIQVTQKDELYYVVHFSIDEWIADGPSVSVILEDWYKIYHGRLDTLREIKSHFKHYVDTVGSRRDDCLRQKQLDYWYAKLSNIPNIYQSEQMLEIKFDRAQLRVRHVKHVGDDVWERLKKRCKDISISPTCLLLSIYSMVIREMERKRRLPISVTISNRLPVVDDVDKFVGPFMETALFLVDDYDGKTLSSTLQSHQRQVWADLEHGLVSGIAVLRNLKWKKRIDRGYSIPFVFTSMLGNFNRNSDTWFASNSYFITQTPQVYLDHQVYEKDGQLVLNWDVVPAIFKVGSVDEHIGRYMDMLNQLSLKSVSWNKVVLKDGFIF